MQPGAFPIKTKTKDGDHRDYASNHKSHSRHTNYDSPADARKKQNYNVSTWRVGSAPAARRGQAQLAIRHRRVFKRAKLDDEELIKLSSPFALVGPGKKDPFATYPGHDIPSVMRDALDFAYDMTWASVMVPRETQLEIDELKRSWRRVCIQTPYLMHAAIVGSAGFAMVLSKDVRTSQSVIRARDEHRQLGLEVMSNYMSKWDGTVPEPLLLVLCGWSTCSGDLNVFIPQPHPVSPLSTAQSIHLFGGMKLVPQHYEALITLVNLKGGMGKVKEYGNLDFIEWVDIFASTVTHQKPKTVWSRGPSRLHLYGFLPRTNINLDILEGIHPRLYYLYDLAFQATVALDHHIRNPSERYLYRQLILTRNEVQHSLLDMTRLFSPSKFNLNDVMQEICRLAGLLYSDLVLYPLPYSSGVKILLANSLLYLLQNSQIDVPSLLLSKYKDILIWTCFMGEIASRRLACHKWFMSVLVQAINLHHLTPQDFLMILKKFLWWDYVCLPPALEILESLSVLEPNFQKHEHLSTTLENTDV